MKFELKTYTRVVIRAEYLGSLMEIDYYGEKKPSQKRVLSLCRNHMREFRYHKETQEYDVMVDSEQRGFVCRHAAVKVSESAHNQISALLSERFMYQSGEEDRKDQQRLKVLELLEAAAAAE